MRAKTLIVEIFRYLLLVVVAIIMFFPILWIASSSFKTLNDISAYPPQLIPVHPQFSNYIQVITKSNLLVYLKNTLILIFGNTIGTLISSSIVAYPLARMEFAGRDFAFGIILATMMVPATATIIPQYILFSKFGWLDSFLPLVIPAFFAYPYNVFLFRQYYKTIPKSLEESAMIDGCNRWNVFTKIIVPISKPIFITIGVLSSIYWWNELFTPLIYINTETLKPLTVGALTSFSTQYVALYNLQMAMAMVMILPPMILYLFAQRYLIEGIKTTGMKD